MTRKTLGVVAVLTFALLLCLTTDLALAGDFDGSKPLVCAMINAFECSPDIGCEGGNPESNGLSRFLRVDFGKQVIHTTRHQEAGTSKIEKVERAEGVMLLSGTQNGRKWSLALTEATGYMVLTVAGDQLAFVVFGVCTPP
jgi:hypothetical protein